MASQYRIERDRGTKEAAQQIEVLRERWPLAFPVKGEDVRPLAISATDEIAAAMGWSRPYTYVRKAGPAAQTRKSPGGGQRLGQGEGVSTGGQRRDTGEAGDGARSDENNITRLRDHMRKAHRRRRDSIDEQ
jgi:hypothetical protein